MTTPQGRCPNCKAKVDPNWGFCEECSEEFTYDYAVQVASEIKEEEKRDKK